MVYQRGIFSRASKRHGILDNTTNATRNCAKDFVGFPIRSLTNSGAIPDLLASRVLGESLASFSCHFPALQTHMTNTSFDTVILLMWYSVQRAA